MGDSEAIDFFKKTIEGKNVIFVGAGSINKDRGLGEWIDSFDVVVKTNGSIFLQKDPNFRRDFGSRIDLFYVNNQFIREMHPLDKDYMDSIGVKGMAFKTPLNKRAQSYGDRFHVRTFKDSVKQIESVMDSSGLTTGAVIKQDIINFNPRYFFATGIDFMWQKPREFSPGNFSEYVSGYLPKKIQDQADKREKGKLYKHSRYKLAMYFKYLYENKLIDTHDEVVDIMDYVIHNRNYYDV